MKGINTKPLLCDKANTLVKGYTIFITSMGESFPKRGDMLLG
ncbi:hypothetical protein [Lysinibacillus xylanilyticus]